MNGSERWVSMSALGAAMFALGFSFASVACNTRDVSVAEVSRDLATRASTAVPAPASSLGTVAQIINAAPAVTPAPVSSGVGTSALTAAELGNAVKLQPAPDGLTLKRFVVTRKIENREPAQGGRFTIGSEPVYAFVEFANTGREARSIRVMFQNEDTKATVGHVKLTVPAAAERFRTWGNTRLIHDPGHWVAVVSTLDGVELGRAPFEVTG